MGTPRSLMLEPQYFGTDGIRGRVGEAPMTPEFALRLGWAAGRVLGRRADARVLIGKDTRRSGYLFESALEAGLSAAGVEVGLLGPVPTPCVAYLTRELGAQAGVVISASHNPHYDNGVKFFSPDGDKLASELELEIESCLSRPLECVPPEQLGLVRRVDREISRYLLFCVSTYQGPALEGLHVVVDCANGAAYQIAPEVLRRLGARVTAIHDQPDGFNINHRCGSTHMRSLQEAVQDAGADVGIALDGDADRCLMVDEHGQRIDGDEILYVIARQRHEAGQLGGPVVGTLMSNLGLELALRRLGVGFQRAQVGDRHVLELLRETGGSVGGETSGHTLCLDRGLTGDGIVSALQVLAEMRLKQAPLSRLVADVRKCPQVLINVEVQGRAAPVLQRASVREAQARVEAGLSGRGRVLLRASGTEPLIRVMVEAEDEAETRLAAEALATAVREALKSPADGVPQSDE